MHYLFTIFFTFYSKKLSSISHFAIECITTHRRKLRRFVVNVHDEFVFFCTCDSCVLLGIKISDVMMEWIVLSFKMATFFLSLIKLLVYLSRRPIFELIDPQNSICNYFGEVSKKSAHHVCTDCSKSFQISIVKTNVRLFQQPNINITEWAMTFQR